MVSISANLNIVFPAEGDETHVFPLSLSTTLSDFNTFLTERKRGLYELFVDGKGTVPLTSSVLSSSGAQKLYNFLPTGMQALAFWRNKSSPDSTEEKQSDDKSEPSQVFYRLGGPAAGPRGTAFVDISADDGKVFLSSARSGLKWKSVANGISFSGMCENPGCEAAGQQVFCSLGVGLFSLDTVETCCPMCRRVVQSTNMGFYRCVYRIRALKAGELKEMRVEWTEIAGDKFQTWDAERAGIAKWAFIEIEVRALRDCVDVPAATKGSPSRAPVAADCGICFHELGRATATNNTRMLSCCHSFHTRCVDAWSERAAARKTEAMCPICRTKI